MTALQTYLMFGALKCHFFRQDYDYFKYNGCLKNLTRKSYASVGERPKHIYEKLGRKYPKQADLENFFVANLLLANNRIAIAQLNNPDAAKTYDLWVARTSGLRNTVLTDIGWLLSKAEPGTPPQESFNALFRPGDHTHPTILRYLLRSQISIETFLVLDMCTAFFPALTRSLGDDVVWENVRFRSDKYRPFLRRLIANPEGLVEAVRDAVLDSSPQAMHGS